MNLLRTLFILVAVLLASSRPLRAADDDAAVRQAVTAFMDDYTNLFMARRADVIAERIYFAPFVIIPMEGPSAWITKQQIRENLEKTFEGLVADGYARSETNKRNVIVLSATSAIVSQTYTRYRKDGSKIATLAATYTVAMTSNGWRIVTLSRHIPEKTLTGN